MIKIILIAGLATATVVSGAYAYVARNVPSHNAVVHPCLEKELTQPPVPRMSTCLCLAQETATFFWTARATVLTAAREAALRTSMRNTCRARSFQSNFGDRGPTRMSPMPRIGG